MSGNKTVNTQGHGGPDLSEALQAKAIALSGRLGREVKRTIKCVSYGHWHEWIVFDGEFHIQREVPVPEWTKPVVDEEERCYMSKCSLGRHQGVHDLLREPDWVVRAEGYDSTWISGPEGYEK